MRYFLSLLIVSAVASSGLLNANACGDKTLRVGRGIRFYKVFAARHPSAILIHTPAIPDGKAPQLNAYLQKVGYKTRTVDDTAQLSEALKSGQYQLALVDLADAANMQRQVESAASKTVIVPVVYKRAKAEQAAAARQYKVIVKNPTDGEDFLAAIYKVMTHRA